MNVVLKLGGSLISSAPDIVKKLLKYAETSKDRDIAIIIVPGGGIFADKVRSVSEKYDIGDGAAHFMAILAMEQYGHYLIDKTGARGIESINDLPCCVSILLPYQIIKGTDELAHSWDVTSDTIAAWVANRLNALFIKVTDVDGVFVGNALIHEISATDLIGMGTTCVDKELPKFICVKNMDCMVVNGHYPKRLIAAIEGETVIGTYIKGNI